MYLDLKSSLMLRLVAGALACFFIAAGLALFGTYRDVRQVNARVADLLARRLQIQLSHIESGIDATARFPDFDLVSEHLQSAGQCVQIRRTRWEHRAFKLYRVQSRYWYAARLVCCPLQLDSISAGRRYSSNFLSR